MVEKEDEMKEKVRMVVMEDDSGSQVADGRWQVAGRCCALSRCRKMSRQIFVLQKAQTGPLLLLLLLLLLSRT